jgi:transposase
MLQALDLRRCDDQERRVVPTQVLAPRSISPEIAAAGGEPMYLREVERIKDGKRHTHFALVESVRTARGPRQRIVARLGELTAEERERWGRLVLHEDRQEGVRQASLGLGDTPAKPAAEVVRVRLDKVSWSNARPFGDAFVGLHLWRLVGLDRIMDRRLKAGREKISPSAMVAVEVISRLCIGQGGPTSEFGLAEHGYRRTALEDLLGVPDEQVTKDRLYRTLDTLWASKEEIEQDLKEHLGNLFHLSYELLLCDLTSTFFEGLADENELAARGHSRDQRGDCKQVVLALVVTPDGFPLYHEVFPGNRHDGVAFPNILKQIEGRFGEARRVWVLDRGIATQENLRFLRERKQSYLVGTPRTRLRDFEAELSTLEWTEVKEHVEVACVRRGTESFVLARSKQRRAKERAIRRRQLLGMHADLKKLSTSVAKGRLRDADKVIERLGRLRERWPKAGRFLHTDVVRTKDGQAERLEWEYHGDRLLAAMHRDGAYLLLSDQTDWSAEQLWSVYMQLTRAEDAFRTMKSQQVLRPIWHHYAHRVQAHVFVCVLAYALWKALDHLLRRAGLRTEIRKPDRSRPRSSPKSRPMSPAVALRLLHDVALGDIQLETEDGRTLRLRRVARPNEEQRQVLAALGLELPERIGPEAEVIRRAREAADRAGAESSTPKM